MQQAGSLRKRVRRTLVKVQGLGLNPYDEMEDNFNVNSLFTGTTKTPKGNPASYSSSSTRSSRITRDPMFSMEEGLDPAEDDLEDEIIYRKNSSSDWEAPTGEDRPYLFRNSDLIRLKIIVFIGMVIGVFPYVWNGKRKRIERYGYKKYVVWRVFAAASAIQTILMFLYHFNELLQQMRQDLDSYRGVFAYFMYVYWLGFGIGYKYTAFFYEAQLRTYVNTLLDFNQSYVEKYVTRIDKKAEFGFGRFVLNYSLPIAATQMSNSILFFVLMPDTPWYFISKIWPKPWYWLIPGAMQDLTVVGHKIVIYMLVAWSTCEHSYSANFWMRETHKGVRSDFTKPELQTPKVSMETYRSLQVLTSIFNDATTTATPFMKSSVMFGMIACAFIILRSLNHFFMEEFPGILVYPMAVVNCSTISFGCLSMSAQMYDIANGFIMSWSRTKLKDFRRVLLSMPTLKVRVARFYFITAATTVTFFRVATDNIINCIITLP